MTFANNMNPDQALQNVGPDLRPILFDTRHQNLLATGCIAWDDLNSKDIENKCYKLSHNFWRVLYIKSTLQIGSFLFGFSIILSYYSRKINSGGMISQ